MPLLRRAFGFIGRHFRKIVFFSSQRPPSDPSQNPEFISATANIQVGVSEVEYINVKSQDDHISATASMTVAVSEV